MPEPDLALIAHRLERIIAELLDLRDEVRGLRSLRDDIGLLRMAAFEMRTMTMNVLDRLEALDAGHEDEEKK
jgi:hypothetical protein